MNNSNHKFIIITAPSGAGKTSITQYLLKKYPKLSFSVSATTRQPRDHEQDGVDYYFINEKEFTQKIYDKEFIEWEMVYKGKYYGTLKKEIERIWEIEKIPVLDIDIHGAIHVQRQFEQQALSIFIQPPSIAELKKRLRKRATESLETIETRLNKATYEISFKGQFNVVIVNDDLLVACEAAEAVIKEYLKW